MVGEDILGDGNTGLDVLDHHGVKDPDRTRDQDQDRAIDQVRNLAHSLALQPGKGEVLLEEVVSIPTCHRVSISRSPWFFSKGSFACGQ